MRMCRCTSRWADVCSEVVIANGYIEPRHPNAQREFAASRSSNSGRRSEKVLTVSCRADLEPKRFVATNRGEPFLFGTNDLGANLPGRQSGSISQPNSTWQHVGVLQLVVDQRLPSSNPVASLMQLELTRRYRCPPPNRLSSFESWLVKPSVCIFVNSSSCMGSSVTTIRTVLPDGKNSATIVLS